VTVNLYSFIGLYGRILDTATHILAKGVAHAGPRGLGPDEMPDLPPQFDYKVWTTRHDEVIAAADLCDEDELGRLRAYLDQQLVHLQGAVTKLANRLQRRLMAQQSRTDRND